jgi:uncharacterized membrane protein YgcG
MGLFASSDATQAQKDQLSLAMKYVYTSPTVLAYLTQANATIVFNNNQVDQSHAESGQIWWDPSSAAVVRAADGSLGVQSAALGLVHELFHYFLGFNEAQATALEAQVARELGEPTRENWADVVYKAREINSTEHTHLGNWEAYNFSGNMTIAGRFTAGDYNPPNAGTGVPPSSGGSSGDPGGGSAGGTYGDGGSAGGGGDDGGSVYCPNCYVIYPDGTKIPVPVPTLDGLDAHLIGAPSVIHI